MIDKRELSAIVRTVSQVVKEFVAKSADEIRAEYKRDLAVTAKQFEAINPFNPDEVREAVRSENAVFTELIRSEVANVAQVSSQASRDSLGPLLESTRRELSEAQALIKKLASRIDELEDKATTPIVPSIEPKAWEPTPEWVRDSVMPELTEALEKGVRGFRERWSEILKRQQPIDGLNEQITAEVTRQFAEMPKPQDGKDAPPVDENAIVERVLKQIPTPKDGRDGKDAEPVDTSEVVKAVLKLVPTPKDGEPGLKGDKGDTGESVHPDSVRVMVVDEVRRAVAEIPRAKDGENGRDALEIDILPAIEEGKSYPLRTFAMHKNGLWRRDSTGWTCIVSGIQGFDVTQSEDLRSFVFTATGSDGTAFKKQFTLPVLEYTGVYKAARTYERGQCVTYDNSMWHCNEPTSEAPGKSAKWTLAVRKGENGKAGKDGSPGPQGPEGKSGRDLRYQ